MVLLMLMVTTVMMILMMLLLNVHGHAFSQRPSNGSPIPRNATCPPSAESQQTFRQKAAHCFVMRLYALPTSDSLFIV